jgi:hypothetical protein
MHAIEIFKTGQHTAMNGLTLSFSAADVAAIAANYNPALHEAPLVVGHPASDLPAYGWVSGLSFADGVLSALPNNVDADFSEMVNARRFGKISAAFYEPNSPSNPVKGSYYLRHVGFLGAQPPAVKGLRSPQFAADDGLVICFEFAEMADNKTIVQRAQAYKANMDAQGYNVSFAESVDAVTHAKDLKKAFLSRPPTHNETVLHNKKTAARVQAYKTKMDAQGVHLTATQAVDAVLANKDR